MTILKFCHSLYFIYFFLVKWASINLSHWLKMNIDGIGQKAKINLPFLEETKQCKWLKGCNKIQYTERDKVTTESDFESLESCYLLWMFGGASAAAPWVARFEYTCRGFVKAAYHWVAAAKRGWTHLRVHWGNVMRKSLHGLTAPSGQDMSHGTVHGTAEVNKQCHNQQHAKYYGMWWTDHNIGGN